jgi:hypothetical protein
MVNNHLPEFKFAIKLQDDYILAEASGIETADIMLKVYVEIIDKVIEWKCNQVLYIEDFSNQIPLEEMLLVWRKIFRIVEDRNIHGRIAVFDRVKDDHTINTVSESLAQAQGINARVFNKLDQAITWLTS